MALKDRLGVASNPVFLMDGTAFIYRGFYANRHLRRSDGFPTNALVVVARTLLKILRQENPEYFLFAMDGGGVNFRNAIYSDYKANREAMPEDLALQIEPITRLVDALGIAREVARGVEADDCIASLAARFSRERPVVIVSGDKDLKQCLANNVFMWDPGSKEEKLLTMAEFQTETGVTPAQWPDVQALVGDSSDNIPGVPGIGPKTAIQIFKTCPTLEDISANLSSLPPKIQDKLKSHLDEMFIWRQLTTLRLDACPNLELANIRLSPIDMPECGKLADEFELASVFREISAVEKGRKMISTQAEGYGVQLELVDGHGGAPALAPVPHIATAEKLPGCAGKDVAVIWPEGLDGECRIALNKSGTGSGEQVEYAWDGKMAELCQWLASSGRIIVADLKPLLVKSPSWRELVFADTRPPYMDLGLASYLLNPDDGDYSWKRISARWRETLTNGASSPAALALRVARALDQNLAANGMTSLYENLELPLAPVLAKMEIRGIAINPAAFKEFLKEVEADAGRLERIVYDEVGEVFNIRSSRQLAEVLFDKLKLHAGRKTRGGQLSTSQLALEKLAPDHPVVENILEFRKLEKMRSTYLEPLPRLMDAEDRLHTTFNQEATTTGRISSSNPNLQNIPVRGPLGKRMRTCFVAGPGMLLAAADYSQIELRLLAHFSRDGALLEAFRNGEDIHSRTAALVLDVAPDQVLPDQRRMAKTINFGLLYGMGAQKLAQELKIGVAQAKEFMERYFARLSGVRRFYDTVLAGARKSGYVVTMTGRRRWLPGIFSANGQASAQAERQAINAVIQGSAADVIKLAMLAVESDPFLNDNGCRLLMQVHDELLLEAPEGVAMEAAKRMAILMENARPDGAQLLAPLVVDWGVGQNWGEAH